MPPVGASILVVDDDPDILDVLADRLEALDYRVVTASTGRRPGPPGGHARSSSCSTSPCPT